MTAETVFFLDVGNTLLGIHWDRVAEVLHPFWPNVTPELLENAEFVRRPSFDRYASNNGGTESADVWRFLWQGIIAEATRFCSTAPTVEILMKNAYHGIAELGQRELLWGRVLPGVPSAVQELHDKGRRPPVITNSNGRAEVLLLRSGLRNLLGSVTDSGCVGAQKPDPKIFFHALTKENVKPHRACYIGDLYWTDVVGARRSGMNAVLLSSCSVNRCPSFRNLSDFVAHLRRPT